MERRGEVGGKTAAHERLGGAPALVGAVLGADFVEVDVQVAALAGEAEEEVLKGEVVEDDDAGAARGRVVDAGVIAVVVAEVVDDGVVVIEAVERGGVAT